MRSNARELIKAIEENRLGSREAQTIFFAGRLFESSVAKQIAIAIKNRIEFIETIIERKKGTLGAITWKNATSNWRRALTNVLQNLPEKERICY